MNEHLKYEVQAVKDLGKSIGYGHLMQLASTLWANDLESHGLPRIGAHIPTSISFLTEDGKLTAKKSDEIYQNLIQEVSE